jgi:tripartite-type tricarboxylate transporter receptor subunit TctC
MILCKTATSSSVWLALPLAIAGSAHAQTFPSKPIRFIVAAAPGGGSDFVARLRGQKNSAAFGQSVIIDNRPGAGGNVGTEIAARATADGYTLLIATSSHASNITLYRKIGYHPIKDFAPIAQLVSNAFLPTIAESGFPGFEVNNWQGLLAPAGTPEPVIARLHAETAIGLRSPDLVERLTAASTEPVATSPTEFAAFLQAEISKWEKVIRQSGARAD